MAILRDYFCVCGFKKDEFDNVNVVCDKCGSEMKLDPVPRCNFIDKNKINNWSYGKSVSQQANALAGNVAPY